MFIRLLLVVFILSTISPFPVFAEGLKPDAKAKIINTEQKEIGFAEFYGAPSGGVIIKISVSGLPPGPHGLHIHSTGLCEADHHFKSAKGHAGKHEDKKHGLLNPLGPEAGDLPNLIVDDLGKANVELFTNLVSVEGSNTHYSLLDHDLSTLIIHENADDHRSQPIGNAGKRIACGRIQPYEDNGEKKPND
jgi:Cu-Zn family superoxide dismutase